MARSWNLLKVSLAGVSFRPRLVCRGGNLARAPEPCLKAHRNDKAKTGDGRSDVFKMRGDLITGHRISPVFFPFEQKWRQSFVYWYGKAGELIVEGWGRSNLIASLFSVRYEARSLAESGEERKECWKSENREDTNNDLRSWENTFPREVSCLTELNSVFEFCDYTFETSPFGMWFWDFLQQH